MRTRYRIAACFGFTMMATLSVFPTKLYLPKPTGKFSVGTKALEIRDVSRTMLRDTNIRRFMVQAYYPSRTHNGVSSYMPGTINNGIVSGVHVLAHAKNGAEFKGARTFPVIIFVPGLGEERQKYTILCEELASYGYVVLALDQPYVSNYVKFPDGTTVVLTCKDAWNVPRNRDYRYQFFDQAMAGAMQDVEYILDHLAELSTTKLGGMCDTTDISIMGHSFGGNVAHTLGFKDLRIRAVVDIDSKITERKIFGHSGVPLNRLKKPVLFIRGMQQYQENVGNQLSMISNATTWSPQVEHSAFSDQAYFAAKIRNYSVPGFFTLLFNWLFKQGPVFSAVDTDLGGKGASEWYLEYRRLVIEWLKTAT